MFQWSEIYLLVYFLVYLIFIYFFIFYFFNTIKEKYTYEPTMNSHGKNGTTRQMKDVENPRTQQKTQIHVDTQVVCDSSASS